jgi:hypothetical protein
MGGPGTSGSVMAGGELAVGLVGEGDAERDAEGDAERDAAVTVTVSAAAGGVHFALVTMLAVAVSVTEVTVVAFDATGICALRFTLWFAGTELMVHVAAPFPLAQPPVNVGVWPVGWEVSATDTTEAGPFSVETCTV